MIARWVIGALGAIAIGAVAVVSDAEERPAAPPTCDAPEQFHYLTDELPFMAQAMKRTGALKAFVIGSASTVGASPESAYPARFEKEMARRLPGVRVSVGVKAKSGLTAAAMVKVIKTEVIPERPSLVIWQTGTVDAVRGVNAEAFADSLVAGIEALHNASIDVILIDMQFSPYTSSMVNLELYRKLMIWVAQRRDVFLFRRYDLMHYWSENQIFDLGVTDRAEQRRVADAIHGCIGELLAAAVLSNRDVAREPPR